MHDVSCKIPLEAFKVVPELSFEELILHVAKHLFGCGIIQAVPLARHASRHIVLFSPIDPFEMLILPPHVAVKRGMSTGRQDLQQGLEHLFLLEHVRRLTDGERQNFIGMEVHDLGEIHLAERQSELGHVSTDLREGRISGEVAINEIGNRMSGALVRAVPPEPLASDFADKLQLPHHLQHRLFRDGEVEFTTQAHEDLPMTATVCRAAEDFLGLLVDVRTRRRLRMPEDVVITRPCQPDDLQKKIKIMLP